MFPAFIPSLIYVYYQVQLVSGLGLVYKSGRVSSVATDCRINEVIVYNLNLTRLRNHQKQINQLNTTLQVLKNPVLEENNNGSRLMKVKILELRKNFYLLTGLLGSLSELVDGSDGKSSDSSISMLPEVPATTTTSRIREQVCKIRDFSQIDDLQIFTDELQLIINSGENLFPASLADTTTNDFKNIFILIETLIGIFERNMQSMKEILEIYENPASISSHLGTKLTIEEKCGYPYFHDEFRFLNFVRNREMLGLKYKRIIHLNNKLAYELLATPIRGYELNIKRGLVMIDKQIGYLSCFSNCCSVRPTSDPCVRLSSHSTPVSTCNFIYVGQVAQRIFTMDGYLEVQGDNTIEVKTNNLRIFNNSILSQQNAEKELLSSDIVDAFEYDFFSENKSIIILGSISGATFITLLTILIHVIKRVKKLGRVARRIRRSRK